ncbi:MAG TPA: response regulator [Bryobacteraceae bacterium]|nr:response regulator [Bryobacteraceae bacterium]
MEKNSALSRARGSEIILLVEDEPAVRRLVSQMLMLAGYTVFEAGSGPEAIGLIGQKRRPVDLLLTDIVMPAMNGGELAERLSRENPHLRVLFTSGYMDDPVVREVVSAGGQFLPKPFSPEALRRKVREVLDLPCAAWAGNGAGGGR